MATDVIANFRALIEAHIEQTTTYDFPIKLYPQGMYATTGLWQGLMTIQRADEEAVVIIDGAYEVYDRSWTKHGEPAHVVWVVASIATIYTSQGFWQVMVDNHQWGDAIRTRTHGNMESLPPAIMRLSNAGERVVKGLMPYREWEHAGWNQGDLRSDVKALWHSRGV